MKQAPADCAASSLPTKSQLRTSGLEHVRVADARPVHDAITYLENHAERLDYAEARRRGLASGASHLDDGPPDELRRSSRGGPAQDSKRNFAAPSGCVSSA